MESNPKALSVEEFSKLKDEGCLIIDTRQSQDVRKGFILGSYPIPLGTFFTKWTEGSIKKDTNLLVVAESGLEHESVSNLTTLGYTNVKGYLEGGFEAWVKAGKPVHEHKGISGSDFVKKLGEKPQILDVRSKDEWDQGVLENAQLINFLELPSRGKEVPKDKPVYVHCKLGGRSLLAYGILTSQGYDNVIDVLGGIESVLVAGGKLQPKSS